MNVPEAGDDRPPVSFQADVKRLADRQSEAVWGLFKAWNEHYVKHGWRDILTGLPLNFDADFFDPRRPSLGAHRRHHTLRVGRGQ